jgi:hypothetical protein
MFVFNRPLGAVLVALAVPVVLVLLDGLLHFGSM